LNESTNELGTDDLVRKFELEIEAHPRSERVLGEPPHTVEPLERAINQAHFELARGIECVIGREAVVHAALSDCQGRPGDRGTAVDNDGRFAPRHEFRVPCNVVHEFEHLRRGIRHECRLMDLWHALERLGAARSDRATTAASSPEGPLKSARETAAR
jgi:hypothetical protein